MKRFLIVCLGGAAGSGTRYLVGLWAGQRFGAGFPYGTLFVNLAGCFLIALVMELALGITAFPEDLRLGLTAGFMGGLTTYSSFNYETTRLFETGAAGNALLNVGVTVAGCAITGVLGLLAGRAVVNA